MIDNSYVYLEYNQGDKRVTYMHRIPVMLLEEGLTDDVKNNPEEYEKIMLERQADYEKRGVFVPRCNVDLPPEDGKTYDQIYDPENNKTTFKLVDTGIDVDSMSDDDIKNLLAKLSNRLG